MNNILEKVWAICNQLEEIQEEICKTYERLENEEKISETGWQMIASASSVAMAINTLEVVIEGNTTRNT